jgi:CheY-like chemotaxis protein
VTGLEKMLRRLSGEHIDRVMVPGRDLTLVKVDPGQVEQVLMNLVVNARDAMPQGGKLTLETSNAWVGDAEAPGLGLRPGEYVLLSVHDTGHGMDAKTRSQIFEPFFTTKELGKGTGLGLSMVYGIIQQSGGSIAVDSEPGQGTTFRIYLPRYEGRAGQPDAARRAAGDARGQETVLLVEDEELVRGMARSILQKAGYTVLEAGDGAEALAVAEKHAETIHLLVSDMIMPRMNGRDLYQRLAQLRPSLRVLFMTGYTDSALLRHGVLDADLPILFKPFPQEEFLSTVREVLEK